jgi:hypothetical protein
MERKDPLRNLLFVFFGCLCVVLLASLAQGAPQQGPLAVVPSAPSTALLARPRAEMWAPPDLDANVPLVNSKSCSLSTVVSQAGRAIQQVLGNLDRFTAKEFVEHQSVNGAGKLARVQTRTFDYLVAIEPGRSGYLRVEEFRNHNGAPAQFWDRVSTQGIPVLVLVFHPRYAPDFQMKCEGLGTWQGQPAWQVRFEQRADRPNHLSAVIVKNRSYTVNLRGRAWILADSYQVAGLETDLVEPIPAIKLRLEHMNVEYGPVTFPGRKTKLWLPAKAELFLDFAGRRLYRRHSFTDFTLFSVDVNQRIASPTGTDLLE